MTALHSRQMTFFWSVIVLVASAGKLKCFQISLLVLETESTIFSNSVDILHWDHTWTNGHTLGVILINYCHDTYRLCHVIISHIQCVVIIVASLAISCFHSPHLHCLDPCSFLQQWVFYHQTCWPCKSSPYVLCGYEWWMHGFNHTLSMRSHPLSGRSCGYGQGVPGHLWGEGEHRFCIFVIGMNSILRFSRASCSGPLCWDSPGFFFSFLLYFFLCSRLRSFHIGLFQYCFHTIEYGQAHSLEQLMKPVVVQATNAGQVGHVALQQTQITGHMVIKMLEVSRFWPESDQNVVGALTLIGMASTKHISTEAQKASIFCICNVFQSLFLLELVYSQTMQILTLLSKINCTAQSHSKYHMHKLFNQRELHILFVLKVFRMGSLPAKNGSLLGQWMVVELGVVE